MIFRCLLLCRRLEAECPCSCQREVVYGPADCDSRSLVFGEPDSRTSNTFQSVCVSARSPSMRPGKAGIVISQIDHRYPTVSVRRYPVVPGLCIIQSSYGHSQHDIFWNGLRPRLGVSSNSRSLRLVRYISDIIRIS